MTQYPTEAQIQAAYRVAQERYALLGVDTEQALQTLTTVPISLHCWQGDDVVGFENFDGGLSGGIAATGNYPGKARTPDELRRDLDQVYRLLPGKHRLNLHAMYAETGGRKVDRNELQPEHFSAWVDWAKANQHGLDFNPTCFSHPKADEQLHAGASRRGDPQLLDRALHRLAPDRRSTSASNSARRASPTSGFPMATRTCRSIASRRAHA